MVMSTIALHLTLNISEPLEAWFQRTTYRKWSIGYQMATWLMTSRDSETRDPNTLRAQYLENSWRCYLATIANFYLVCCLGSTVGYSSDSLASCVFRCTVQHCHFIVYCWERRQHVPDSLWCVSRDGRCDRPGCHGGSERVHRLHSVARSDLVHDRRTVVLWIPVQWIPCQSPRPGAAVRRPADGHGQRHRHDRTVLATVLPRHHHFHFRGSK